MRRHFGDFHIVRNFPEDYSRTDRFMAHLLYLAAEFHPRPRANWLDPVELEPARGTLRPGDLILLGNLRTMLSRFLDGPITHSGIFSGNGTVINCIADGVSEKSLERIFDEYDTFAVLRIPGDAADREGIVRRVLALAVAEIGKPYDFFFSGRGDAFFCTSFVNSVYRRAGFDTGVGDFRKGGRRCRFAPRLLVRARNGLQPLDFLSRFDLLFWSGRLKREGETLVLGTDGES